MSDAFWIAFWAGLPGVIASIFAGWIAMKQATMTRQIEQVHKATNGLTDKLVDKTKEAAFVSGINHEKERVETEKKNGNDKVTS